MNQEFNVKKKQYLSEKKNRAEGFTWKKKIPAQAVREKKFVQAENWPKREKGFWSPEKAIFFL